MAVGEELLEERRSTPVFRIAALQAFDKRHRHGPVQERVLAVHLFATTQRGSRARPDWQRDGMPGIPHLRTVTMKRGVSAYVVGGVYRFGMRKLRYAVAVDCSMNPMVPLGSTSIDWLNVPEGPLLMPGRKW